MSSSRVYLISGSCLRVRRYPRSSLPRYIALNHITKRPLQYTIRSCSGWRHNGRYPHRDNQVKTEKAGQPEEKRGKSPWENSPYEPSRREKMWQDRMDRIRRMMDENPYEALFGHSNRLLKGLSQNWHLDHHKWWQREVNFTVRNPFVARNNGDAMEQPSEKIDTLSSTGARAKTSEVEPEHQLEYDPISNRMVRRSDVTAARHERRAAATTPRNTPKQSDAPMPNADLEQGVDIPVKPYRPNVDPQIQATPPRREPTFTMLKEDLAFEAPVKDDLAPTTSARAEYEKYKTKRLQEAVKSKQWLEDEGFGTYDGSIQTPTHGMKSNMDKQFDNLLSGNQELAEEQLVHKKPWAMQRSNGTSARSPSPSSTRLATIRANGETEADKEIQEYTMQVAGDNLKNMRRVEETTPVQKRTENLPAASHQRLVHPADNALANKDIRDYAIRVASDNIKNKKSDEKLQIRELVEAETRRQAFAKFNEESKRLAELRQQESTLPALEGIKKLSDMVQEAKVQLAKIEQTQAHRSTPPGINDTIKTPELNAKDENTLKTSLQRYRERSVVAKASPLKTSLQRLGNDATETSQTAPKPSSLIVEQTRTHDPVGYNHDRESRRVQQLASPTGARSKFKVPSLAEIFGYKKPNDDKPKEVGSQQADAPDAHLQSEVDAQRAAFESFESGNNAVEVPSSSHFESAQNLGGMRGDIAPTTAELSTVIAKESIPQRVVKGIEQKKKDAALVREIRQIYESKYGPITTSHTQSMEAEKSVQDAIQPSLETTAPVNNTLAPLHTKMPKESSATIAMTTEQLPASEIPASSLTTPKPATTAQYTILAYDSKSKNMTSASFESIPSSSETTIPGTIALRHLAYANRFLPKLIELQHRGFVPVHAERNLLILRQDTTKSTSEDARGFTPGEDPVKNEPVADESATGTGTKEPRRLEPIFSGGKNREKAWRRWKEARSAARRARRRRFGRAVKFVAGGVVLSGAVIYLAGVGAEVRLNRGRGKVVLTDDRRNWYDHPTDELEARKRG